MFPVFFFFAFARFYWWMNFSPDSGIQTAFIIATIPIYFCAIHWLSPEYSWVIFITYVFIFLAIGFYRVRFLRYKISKEELTISLCKDKTWQIDRSRKILVNRNYRGKILDFGCLIVPVLHQKKVAKGLFHSILSAQRSMNHHSNTIRIDGIKNVENVLKEINQKLYEQR